MVVFSSTPGVVSAVMTGTALPFALAVGGNDPVPAFPDYGLAKAILTGFTVDAESGLGVNHTLRDRIYVYVHGERAGAVTVSGVAFGDVCSASGPPYTGIDAVHAYYESARVSTQGLPVQLIMSPLTTLFGFMTGLRLGVEDAAAGVGSFQFKFVSMPRYVGQFGTVPALPWQAASAAAEDD